MKITVAIPAYNSAATIRETLDSVFRQTVAPDEILVVNHRSTDATHAILDSYGSRITAIHQENAGVASARNLLCTRANGDLVAFLDGDDL
jgi:glycosyltransferase involved in cell wall biosynthesis